MLDIYTNNYSYIAQTNLVKATSAQAKSIERLSSGLRINHASDDASGLALSDKLRAQIGSLARASMNAQDAISYLQTAQNGLDVISDMLNRMKDLAIQAGNSAYTSNDRREMQIEVDHIKNEINRISSSTEYNTKKLLTGSSLALWSSNSSEIDAIIRGAVAEGNYRLDITINPGQNAIYRSETMNMKEPGYDVKYFGVGAPAVSSVK
ncbi:MAG: flagellin, partial [Deferribacteraceae bacterium]|nr:flagellin [Deferribacteraceae bacterium]